MKTTDPSSWRGKFMTVVALLPVTVSLVCRATAAVGGAAGQLDGAALFKKHCFACHREAPRPMPAENFVAIMRSPRAPMPAFDEEKLPDRDARAIAAYLEHPDTAAAGSEKAGPEVHILPPATPVAPSPPASHAAPAPAKIVKARPAGEKKPVKKRNAAARSFVRTWTIQGIRNNEVITLQKIQIAEKGKDELAAIPSLHLSDYAVTVTSLEVIDRNLKLRLSWTWKNSASYWRTEDYDLNLSDDGTKLSGRLTVRSSANPEATFAVWGE